MSKVTTLAQVLANTKEPTTPNGGQRLSSKRCQTPQHDINSQELAQLLASVPAEQPSSNQDQRLRWLAFYYLSKRELSQQALRQKLLAKDQDPNKVEALLTEFAHKGYQSDERCAYMLIREAIRRGRGKQHIAHSLSQHGIDLPYSLDELIARADTDSLCDGTILDDTNNKDNIDWLRLAVETRSKKYGNTLPTTPKDKARQLRFLQYRGFEMAICFDALKTTLDELD
ncbi:MAG: regulatory protein RecX [Moraxella sp.]|nr:regulatory protein RecX [Moraxella sp.]